MKGMVVCTEPRAAEEGSKILARGGNAIDAAVTAAFVQFIVNPTECGVGGFGTMNIYQARTGKCVILDFQGRAGAKVTPEMWQDRIISLSADTYLLKDNVNMLGHTSVTTPGTVRGLYQALTEYGTKNWQEVIEPAISYAENGVPVDTRTAALSYQLMPAGFPTHEKIMKCTPGSRKLWYKEDGSPYSSGELRVNKDYARTLRRIMDEGPDSVYTGSIAREIIEDMEKHGGFITASDLKDYKTATYTPIRSTYRGYELLANRPPGCGVTLLQLLNILEGYPLAGMQTDSVEYNWLLVQAMRAANADRVQYLGDIEFADVPVEMLISKERGEYWRKKIDAGERIVVSKTQLVPRTSTTHLCAIDEVGNCVSFTHSNGSNSGCVTPGLGFIHNNSMVLFYAMPGLPNSIASGKARVTGMSPTMIFKDGRLVMAIGASGGFAIMSAVAQSIINVIDHGMSIGEAVSSPRVHCEGGLIELEGRIRAGVAEELRRKGNPVYHWPDGFARRMAQVHSINIELLTQEWKGGADPRGNGGIAWSHA